MGVVAFYLGVEGSLTLLQNRDNYESMVIDEANWGEGQQILGGFLKPNGGTWLGCSRNGRIAFLAEKMPFDSNSRSELLPILFLKSSDSPQEFAAKVLAEDVLYRGLNFRMVVATPNSNAVVYISKPSSVHKDVTVEPVVPGFHILSPEGLDANLNLYEGLKSKFMDHFGRIDNRNLGSFAAIMRTDDVGASNYFQDLRTVPKKTKPQVETRFGTTSTTALTVQPGGEVHFYETHLRNGEWSEKDLHFDITN